jgi:hypothetical protein
MTHFCHDCGAAITTDGPFRVTVEAIGVYLEGVVPSLDEARQLADGVKPLGWMVYASPMEEHSHDPVS